MHARSERPWLGVLGLDAVIDRRLRRPRQRGITMVIDTGLGQIATADILEIAAPHVDHWKFAFGTSALMPAHVLRHKLELLAAYGLLTYPGGTLLEAAIVQQHCRVYMRQARELGFQAVEISDGTIDLPADRRRRVIDCARDAGLVAITEVGKKDPSRQPGAAELAEQALQDLECGAAWVIVEARESGHGIGIYDNAGALKDGFLEEIASLMGKSTDRLIWEAPQKDQQAALVRRFGANVSLGNVAAREALALEALRSGLHYETLSQIVECERAAGQWDPAMSEAPDERAVTEQLALHEVSSHG
ncbi:Phosphosulfolactate synthase (plasmid) [Xanthobacter versatilis]|uniref:Phosphosulfolactate synthase n=1 Tax=Xanthobacter autotrophicus (strain ATCC BAA-1158 / Py2) TaxID=78245 RepID=A7IQH1_XANP2|nr:Phosphosulfolactate synthase [Xanthobacter autotrophicus Py2]